MSATCEFLDESSGEHSESVTRVAKVAVTGFVSLACHNHVTRKLEEGIRKNSGKMRMIETIKRFSGLDPMAIVPNALFNLRNHSEFERVAVVSNDRLLTSAASALAPMISTEVRTFPDEEYQDAIIWIKQELSPSAPREAKSSR